MQFIKSKLRQLYASDAVRRVFHTFWQAFLASLVLSSANLAGMPSLSDAQKLLVAAVAAGLAALKVVYLNRKG